MRPIARRESTITALAVKLAALSTEQLKARLGDHVTPYTRLAIQRILRVRGEGA